MDNLSSAKADITASLAALKEPHLWIMAVLYIGTFGSFIGFAGVFPKLLADTFPDFKGIAIGTATVTLAFLGALVGSLARPYGGKLADRFGGTVITMGAFTVMGLGILGVILTLPMQNFAVFLLCFLVLFAAAGMGNGSTYRMIPTIFALARTTGSARSARPPRPSASSRRSARTAGSSSRSCSASRRRRSARTPRRSAGSPWRTSPSSPSPPASTCGWRRRRHPDLMTMSSADTHCPYCALQCAMTVTHDGSTTVAGRDFPTNRGGSAPRAGRRRSSWHPPRDSGCR